MNGELLVQVRSTGPRSIADIERDIDESMTRTRTLIREKVIAQLNLRVVGVEDTDSAPTVPAVVDESTPSTSDTEREWMDPREKRPAR